MSGSDAWPTAPLDGLLMKFTRGFHFSSHGECAAHGDCFLILLYLPSHLIQVSRVILNSERMKQLLGDEDGTERENLEVS